MIDNELNKLLTAINKEGHQFLKNYFKELISSKLSEENELELIEVAIKTIKADSKVEYSEIKFFKVIRSKLKISNDLILAKNPDFEEYLEHDIISESYLSKLQDDFFESQVLPLFQMIGDIDQDIINK